MEESDKLFLMELGKRISFFRNQKGHTQAQLSDLTETEFAVSRIELGGQIPHLKCFSWFIGD